MRSKLSLLFGLLVSVACATDLPRVWTAASVPSTADLWGATWTGGQFVAVGKSGTILTSPDGLQWTARTSATSEWLLGVVFSSDLQRYVVVGDHGTILTSRDAITWTPAVSGTAERLNGVAAGGGRVVAVGEHGTAVSSSDGATWTATQLQATGWLRGIAYVDGHFLIGGSQYEPSDPVMPNYVTTDGVTYDTVPDNPWGTACEGITTDGHVVLTLSDFMASSPAVYPPRFEQVGTTPHMYYTYFRGIARFDDGYIVCGAGTDVDVEYVSDGGAADWKHFLPIGPVEFTAAAANANVAIVVGAGGTIERTVATPSAPAVQSIHSSHYSTTEKVTPGSSMTFTAVVSGSGPLTYLWFHDGQPIAGATTQMLTISSAQPADAGAYTIRVSNALGTVESSAVRLVVVSAVPQQPVADPDFAPSFHASYVAEQPDGKVLLFGDPDGSGSARVVRVDAQGAIDRGFQPLPESASVKVEFWADGSLLTIGTQVRRYRADGTPDLTFQAFTPEAGTGYELLPNGSILGITLSENVLALTRRGADGVIDASYPATRVPLAPPSTGLEEPYHSVFAIDPAGGAVLGIVATSHSDDMASSTRFFRVSEAGVIADPAKAQTLERRPVTDMVITADGVHALCRNWLKLGYYYYDYAAFTRLTSSFAIDPSYEDFECGYANLGVLESNGMALCFEHGSDGAVATWADPDGRVDPSSPATLAGEEAPYQIWRGAGGHLFVKTGSVNGTSVPGVARLRIGAHPASTRLTNVSVRATAGSGTATLILGMSLLGDGTKTLLARGIGPALADYGVSDAVADPTLAVVDLSGQVHETNDDWSTGPDLAALTTLTSQVYAFPLPAASPDAAVLTHLEAGSHTVQVSAKSGTGVALAEAYDPDPAPADYHAIRVANFSARALAGTGSHTLVLGFTVAGPGSKVLLIRGVGPGLTPYGVQGVLAHPALSLYRGATLVGFADKSGQCVADADAVTTHPSYSAFPVTYDDAVLEIKLPAGAYTAQVSGADGGTGIALVELYEGR